jgi:glucosamine--fructose-6-phosphate aminotransferase (isomerizing)
VEPAIELGVDIDADDILILGCGTSYHAGLVGKYIIEELSTIPVRVEIASEFNYDHTVLGKTLVIGITQSGESADTLLGLKKAKRLGNKTMVITNVLGSSATRIADQVFYIRAGPEISVAATKSFTAQLVALYLIALSAAKIELKGRASLVEELRKLPVKVQRILDEEEKIAQLGRYVAGFDHAFFVARGINFPIALEGALKLKEISYIHAEGYPAGELKHGPFALLTPHTPVIAIAAKDDTYEAVLTNIKEIKARESPVIAVAEESDDEIEKYVDFVIKVPGVEPIFSPVVNSVALQLLAYYAARERGCPIDMPRNLAKSVTVE